MNRDQFLRSIRRQSKEMGLEFYIDRHLGKGSHYRVTVGERTTTVKSGELSPVYVALVRKQLGLD